MNNHAVSPEGMTPQPPEEFPAPADVSIEGLDQLIDAEPWMAPEAIADTADRIFNLNLSLRVRYGLLVQLADRLNATLAPLTACHKGCHHCCFLTTLIYRFEAIRLAEVSGRIMTEIPIRLPQEVIAMAESRPRQRCPFLVAGACSVYADRPMICRLHHSLGRNPDRCLPLPSGAPQQRWMYDPDHVEMPYHILVGMLRPKEPWGAITEFFPERGE